MADAPARCIRLSWRAVEPGMRAWDPARHHPLILECGRLDDRLRTSGHPAWTTTTCGYGWTPKAGFVKVLGAAP
jgi:hypothetical protein